MKKLIDIDSNKEKFKKWIKKYVVSEENAKNVDAFIAFLESTDFFIAPASTRFHSNCPGGLCQHTINVVARLFKIVNSEYSQETIKKPDFKENVFLAAALHDLCKINFYKETTRVKKDEKGNKYQYPFWEIEDRFPMGHGEKSLYLAQKFFNLNDEVAIAIRWHMGWSDASAKGGSQCVGNAFAAYPLALYLHTADSFASFLDEEITKY